MSENRKVRGSSRTETNTNAHAYNESTELLGDLCAPCLGLGQDRPTPAVTMVTGTAMCAEHARKHFGDVITRG